MDKINIIPAQKEHIPFLKDAEALIFSDAWSESALSSHLSLASARALLALDGAGRIVGYLLGSVIPPEAEVYRIATLPEARRRGIGRVLLGAFLGEADECFLEVRESNAPARALYEAEGFVLVGERRGYYKNPVETALVYKWEKN